MNADVLSERKVAQSKKQPRRPRDSKTPGRVWQRIGSTVFYLAMILLVAWAFWFSRSDDPSKSLFGFRFYYIQTPSMEPEIPVGSAIFTRYTDPEEIQVGDVVTYYLDDTSISHEVVEVLPASDESGLPWFRTQGIANEEPDPQLVRGDAVAGVVVFSVPNLGFLMSWIGSHIFLTLWLFVLICILCTLTDWLLHSGKKQPKDTAASHQP